MSLPDAVLEIAQELAAEAKDWLDSENEDKHELFGSFLSYAKQLRSAVKAAEGVAPPVNPLALLPGASFDHRARIEAAKAEFRGKQELAEDREGARVVITLDGPEAGVSVPLAAEAPVGARCFVGTYVYELDTDGRLRYVEGKPCNWPSKR